MNKEEQLNALSDIRNMMDRSSRFISLSGLSGVFAGIVALIGAYLAQQHLHDYQNGAYGYGVASELQLESKLITIAILILLIALIGGFAFTYRQARKKQIPIWDKTAKNLLINLAIPLVAGGLFIIAILLNHSGAIVLVAPSCLIFYGLALVNASKYTFSDIKFLGLCEITLGIIAVFNTGLGLYFWAFGFGILHIIYGAIMFFKYEKSK